MLLERTAVLQCAVKCIILGLAKFSKPNTMVSIPDSVRSAISRYLLFSERKEEYDRLTRDEDGYKKAWAEEWEKMKTEVCFGDDAVFKELNKRATADLTIMEPEVSGDASTPPPAPGFSN